jgi:hypothetical protein
MGTFGFGGKHAAMPGSPPRRCLILLARRLHCSGLIGAEANMNESVGLIPLSSQAVHRSQRARAWEYDWLFGENGNRYRRTWHPDTRPSGSLPAETLDAWRAFLETNRDRPMHDLEAEVERTYVEHGEPRVPSRKGRRRVLPRPDPELLMPD